MNDALINKEINIKNCLIKEDKIMIDKKDFKKLCICVECKNVYMPTFYTVNNEKIKNRNYCYNCINKRIGLKGISKEMY